MEAGKAIKPAASSSLISTEATGNWYSRNEKIFHLPLKKH
jgi:hypothetical protein